MSFFLTLGIIVTIMVTFFTKRTQSFSKENTNTKNPEMENGYTIPLLSAFADTKEDYTIKNNDEVEPSMPHFPTVVSATVVSYTTTKKDPGGLGFLDEVGGSVDGLMSCTESLGFESSDERRIDDIDTEIFEKKMGYCPKRVSRRTNVKAEVKKFPPPLSSLNADGKPNFFLRPVRKDGRLELMEVRVERPEILRTSRKDGRLRLDLIREADQIEEEEHEMEEKIEKFVEDKDEKWDFPMMMSGGDGFWRCHEAVTRHHHHHDMHGWRQPCVEIR